jgi:mannitol/fructose-specific phosphotransferase system IIA component (Ntr-type)
MKGKKSMYIPKLSDLLTEDTVVVRASASDWKDAIRKSGELLLNINAIEPRYIDAMIKFCEEHHAYIVITPGVALPHARPEDGVKRTCLSLVTLEEPVRFGHPHNDPVDLVIALGAIDNKSHIKALGQLAEMLMDQENLERIKNAQTKKDVLKIIGKREEPERQNFDLKE